MQVGMGFWAAKVLLAANRLGLFTRLAGGSMSAEAIRAELGLGKRGLFDFLDTLVALGFLEREGFLDSATYRNSADTDAFLDRNKPGYIGGILEMANDRLYPFWSNLEESLRTGEPQNETREGGADLFERIYEDSARLEQFVNAMSGAQAGAFIALAEAFDFTPFETLCDVGGASAALSIQVARRHEHMRCVSLDMPKVVAIARERIEAAGLADRVEARSVNFFEEPLPKADLVTMGNILHDWGVEEKKLLIRKAFEALPEGGALVVVENIIDDDRRENVFGLLMSLNMLIETRQGFDFTGADFGRWAREAGFRRTEVIPLVGPTSAAVAWK